MVYLTVITVIDEDGRGVKTVNTYAFQYAYNGNGQLAKTTYPGGLEVAYGYDDYGFKTQATIGDKVIYRLEHADGLESSASFMGKLVSRQLRDSCGYENTIAVRENGELKIYLAFTDNLGSILSVMDEDKTWLRY